MVRTVAPEPLEFAVHQGMFVYPTALFIEAVKTRPELRERFGADAGEFLAFINKHVFEKNEQDWLDMGELGGGYRFATQAHRPLPQPDHAAQPVCGPGPSVARAEGPGGRPSADGPAGRADGSLFPQPLGAGQRAQRLSLALLGLDRIRPAGCSPATKTPATPR